MEKKRITILPHQFDNNDYFLVKFNYDESLISIAQSIGCRWVVTDEGWAIYRSKANLNTLVRAFGDIAIVDTSKIGFNSDRDENKEHFKRVPEAYLKLLEDEKYSESAIKVYTSLFREFINYFPDTTPKDITLVDVRDYQDFLIRIKKVSGSTRIKAFEAIKLYFEKILLWDSIEYVADADQSEETASDLISEEEVTRMIKVTKNLKHKAILDLLYRAELQSEELINVRIEDLNLDTSELVIHDEKDNSRRTIILKDKTTILLINYLEQNQPGVWLFEGTEGRQYSTSSILSLLRRASFKAGLGKVTGMRKFQSSFDSQLIEEDLIEPQTQSRSESSNSNDQKIISVSTTPEGSSKRIDTTKSHNSERKQQGDSKDQRKDPPLITNPKSKKNWGS